MEPNFRLEYQYHTDFLRVKRKAWYCTTLLAPCKSIIILKPYRWYTGSVDPSYAFSYGILKCFDSGSCIMRASKGGLVIKPRSLFLGGAKPYRISRRRFISRNLRSTSTSLAGCVVEGWEINELEWTFHLIEAGGTPPCLPRSSWATGGTGFPCLMFWGKGSHRGSRHDAPKGAKVCGGRTSSAHGCGASVGVTGTAKRCLARMAVSLCTC